MFLRPAFTADTIQNFSQCLPARSNTALQYCPPTIRMDLLAQGHETQSAPHSDAVGALSRSHPGIRQLSSISTQSGCR